MNKTTESDGGREMKKYLLHPGQARDVNTTVRLLAKYYRIKSRVKKLKWKIPSPKLCAAVNAIKSHKDGECHYIDYRKSFLMEINKLSKMKRDLRHVLNRSWLHNERIMQEIDNLKAQIAKLQADNRSLVEQMNAMALKPNQEVIDWHSYIEKKPEKTGYYIIYYTILNRVAFDFWHNDKQEWDKYGEYILAWAYLPKGVKHENTRLL